jgi:predicted nuclease of predicted toxin-antitoxin system
MVVWVDAQLPPALARWLTQEHGMAATHVQDVGLLAAPDEVIFASARTAGVAIVVTKDEDFVQLLERLGSPPQVVWVTCGNVGNAELRRIVQAAWPRVAELLAAGEPLVELHQRT